MEFDFSFTTNDSDITIFEPFLDEIKKLIGIESVTKNMNEFVYNYVLRDKIMLKQQTNKKNKSRVKIQIDIDGLKKELTALHEEYKKRIHENIGGQYKKSIAHVGQICDTLANVVIQHELCKTELIDYLREKGICPHVEKRKKKK
jgi:hypothetical protein